MAFLAYLGEHEFDIVTDHEAGPHRALVQFHAFGGDVFGKVAGVHIGTDAAHVFDIFHGKQAELAVRAVGMDVALDAEVLDEVDLGLGDLLLALAGAGGNGDDAHCYLLNIYVCRRGRR